VRSNLSVINVYKKKTKKSKVVTQLLYGDTFKELTQNSSWIKIKNDSDNYIGYIKNKKFLQKHKNTHKISVLCSNLYLKPNSKNKIFVYYDSKFKIKCERRFEIENSKVVGFTSKNCW